LSEYQAEQVDGQGDDPIGQIVDFKDVRLSKASEVIAYLTANTTLSPTAGELEEKGWLPWMDNGFVTIASTGYLVWATDSSGLHEESNSSGIKNASDFIKALGIVSKPIRVGTYPEQGDSLVGDTTNGLVKRLARVTFVSNAGGSIDTDPELVPALAGYYPVMRVISVVADATITGLLEIQAGSTQIEGMLGLDVTADEWDDFKENYWWRGVDAEAISLDGSGCSALGNATTIVLILEYWYET
jgi:hypothetical protein